MSKITARDHKLLALLKSGKTLIYIAPKLALEMFSQKMGRVAMEGKEMYIKQLSSRMSKGFNRPTRDLTPVPHSPNLISI